MNFIDADGSGNPVKFINWLAFHFRSLFQLERQAERTALKRNSLHPPLMPPFLFFLLLCNFKTLAYPHPRVIYYYSCIYVRNLINQILYLVSEKSFSMDSEFN